MNLRTAALIIASASLLTGTAIAQQDNRRNQDHQNRARDNQSNRSAPPSGRGYRQDNRSGSIFGGNGNNNGRGGSSSYSPPNRDRNNPPSQGFGSWRNNPGRNSNDNSSNRSGSNPGFGRFRDQQSPPTDSGYGRNRFQPQQPIRQSQNRNRYGSDIFQSPRQTPPDQNYNRDPFSQRPGFGHNQSQDPSSGRNQQPPIRQSQNRNRYGSDIFQSPRQTPPDHQTQNAHGRPGFNSGRPGSGRFEQQPGSQVRQPRPAFGNSWNFGRDRELMHRNYENDRRTYDLQIVNNYNLYQRPEWGNHWREGYCGWEGDAGFGGVGFRSGNFSFGFYLFTPFSSPCYVSPWYYYTSLPPYIPAERCHVVRDYYCPWDEGAVYSYRPGSGYNDLYVDENLDNAIGEIQDAFNRQDSGAIDALIPDRGRIAVFTEGHYDYSLDANDFHNMMMDNIGNTETIGFEIESVRRSGNNAVVRARHTVRNPDGDEEVVYQQYRLRRENGRFVITDFMTSH